MKEFNKLSDYEKEIFIERNIWELSNIELKTLISIDNFDDDRVYSRLIYNIFSTLDYLDIEKIEKIKSIFSFDFDGLKKLLLNNVKINIADVCDFNYDNEDECYYVRRNQLYNILSNINDEAQAKDAIILYNKYKNRIFFKENQDKLDYLILKDYKSIEHKYYTEKFNAAKNITEKKNILFIKKYNISIDDLMILLNKIKQNNFENHIENFNILLELINSNDLGLIESKFKNLEENHHLISEIESKIKQLCVEDVSRTIKMYTPSISHDYNDGIEIFDISNENFNLLIHRTNAVSNNINVDPINYMEYSKFNQNGKTTISCSGISNLFMGRVEHDEKNIYFGFGNISSEHIIDMGPNNINMSDALNDNIPDSITGNNFMSFEKLMENSFDQYNEIALFRYDQHTGELLKPTYIVCFDEIDDLSKKVAKRYGIPIYFIDTKIVYSKTRQKLEELMQDEECYCDEIKNKELINKFLSFAYGAYCSGRMELNQLSLQQVLDKTYNSKYLSDTYKAHIKKYVKEKNNGIGFGIGDKYILTTVRSALKVTSAALSADVQSVEESELNSENIMEGATKDD